MNFNMKRTHLALKILCSCNNNKINYKDKSILEEEYLWQILYIPILWIFSHNENHSLIESENLIPPTKQRVDIHTS